MTEMVELRRGSPAVGWFLVSLGAAIAASATYLAIARGPEFLGLGVFAVPPLAIGAWGLIHRIRIDDDGVEVWNFFDRPRLNYGEVERLTYRTVQIGANAVPVGYYVGLVLRGAGRKVAFIGRLEGGMSQRFEAVRDRAAGVIADAAIEKLGRGEAFAWTPRGPRVQLRNEGIAFRPARFVGHGDEEVMPYSAGFTYSFSGEWLMLRAGDRKLFKVPASADDFYPGFVLFDRLVLRDGGTFTAG